MFQVLADIAAAPLPHDVNEVVPFLTSAATVAFVQKWLKTTQPYATFIKAFPGSDKYAHWCVAGIGSLIAATGIHLTWNWDMTAGGTFSGTIPSAWILLHGISDWFKVYILQHTVYESTRQTPYAPPK